MEGIPDIDQKNKNYEEISDLILEKFDLLSNKDDAFNEQKENFDDTFMIIKFNDFEEKVIQRIKYKEEYFKDLNKDMNYDEYLNIIKNNVNNLKMREKKLISEKNKLIKSIDSSKNINQKDENIEKYIQYIIELGKETEK